MNLGEEIKREFFLSENNVVSDRFICDNTDLLWLKEEIDYMIYVPSYMLWCVKNGDADGNLVCDRTISALAEFGRAKNAENRLNFKFLCNDKQRFVVFSFLAMVSFRPKIP